MMTICRVLFFTIALAALADAQNCQVKLHSDVALQSWDESKSFCEAQGGPGSRLATWQEYCPNGQNNPPAFLNGPIQEGIDHKIAPAYFNNGGRVLQTYAWASLNTCTLGLGTHFFAPNLTAELADVVYCSVCEEESADEEPAVEEPVAESTSADSSESSSSEDAAVPAKGKNLRGRR
jgi:hypothetical protein